MSAEEDQQKNMDTIFKSGRMCFIKVGIDKTVQKILRYISVFQPELSNAVFQV